MKISAVVDVIEVMHIHKLFFVLRMNFHFLSVEAIAFGEDLVRF